jgi:CRP/FNR family transcriptional regulator, cyclic AMP receptor protein
MAAPYAENNPLPPALSGRLSPHLAALAQRCERRRYRNRQGVIVEGEPGDTMYLILEGQLQAFSTSVDGQEFVFNTYDPGDYVGEMGLDGGPRSASVRALGSTLCAVITRPVLMQYVEEQPRFAFELIAKVIWRARMATSTARLLAFNGVYGLLKALLESLAVQESDGRLIVPVRLTHADIANRCGCSRERITRVMKELHPHYVKVLPDKRLELLRPLPAKL